MPDQPNNNNNQQQTNNNTQPTAGNQPSVSVPDFLTADSSATTPPMMTTATNTPTPQQPKEEKPTDQKPGEEVKPEKLPEVMTTSPKKKFGGGRIIATILGFLVLAGGIAGGVILTQQQQDIREKAQTIGGGLGGGTTTSTKTGTGVGSGSTGSTSGTSSGGSLSGGAGGGTSGGGGSIGSKDGDTTHDTGSTGGGTSGGGGLIGSGVGDTTHDTGSTGSIDKDSIGTCVGPNCSSGGSCTQCSGTTCVAWDPTGPFPGNDSCAHNADAAPGCTTINAINGTCTNRGVTGNGCIDSGCGGGQVCHCQGGVSCDFGVCVDEGTFTTACNGDGRVVATNTGEAVTCCESGYVAGPGNIGCVQGSGGGGGGGGGGTTTITTNTGESASCQNIKAYDESFSLLSATDLTHLSVGDTVKFCVAGTTTSSTDFDKAFFLVNGIGSQETTTRRPGSTDFCSDYVIPSNITQFNIEVLIHHPTLGWK